MKPLRRTSDFHMLMATLYFGYVPWPDRRMELKINTYTPSVSVMVQHHVEVNTANALAVLTLFENYYMDISFDSEELVEEILLPIRSSDNENLTCYALLRNLACALNDELGLLHEE